MGPEKASPAKVGTLARAGKGRQEVAVNHRIAQALAAAFALPAVRVEPVRLPTAPVAPAVFRRLAENAPVSLRPISIAAPAHDDDATVQAFVVEQFVEARMKRRRRAA